MGNIIKIFKFLYNILLKYTKNFIIFMLILAFIGCYKKINSYNVSLSIYCLSTLLVLLPLFDKLLKKIKVKLTNYQKTFIIIFTYIPLGFVNNINSPRYEQTLITLIITIVIWFLVCIYSKYKKIK